MTGRKSSVLKSAMIITLIATLNLLGISYGYWQDSLIGILKAQTGDVELNFVGKPEVESEGVSIFESNLYVGEGSKSIEFKVEVEKAIEGSTGGKIWLDYIVENNGSVPVEFDGIQVRDSQMEGLEISNEPEEQEIIPGGSKSGRITISIDASAVNYSLTDTLEADSLESNNTEEDAYEFEIGLPYKIGSWTDELTIWGEIKVVPPSTITTVLAPMPAMTIMPVQGEPVTDGLPEGPSDEDLYGEGGTAAENDTPEAIEGDDEGESPGDQELYDTGEIAVDTDESEAIEDDSETASEIDVEEGSGEQEQADAGEATEEADEPEDIENDSDQSSEGIGEEEVTSEESEEDDGDEAAQEDSELADEFEGEEEESGDQEQADGGEATEEADEPEDVENNSDQASAGDDEGESSDDQVQIDTGEGN